MLFYGLHYSLAYAFVRLSVCTSVLLLWFFYSFRSSFLFPYYGFYCLFGFPISFFTICTFISAHRPGSQYCDCFCFYSRFLVTILFPLRFNYSAFIFFFFVPIFPFCSYIFCIFTVSSQKFCLQARIVILRLYPVFIKKLHFLYFERLGSWLWIITYI